MNESKMPNVVVGVLSSWVAWLLSVSLWLGTHLGQVSFGFAIMASIYGIRASIEDWRLKRAQRKLIEGIDKNL